MLEKGKGVSSTPFLNITESKQAEEELARLSEAVRISADSIVISDVEGKIIYVNEATLKMYGTDDPKDLLGKSSFELIAPEDREKAFAGMKEVMERGYAKDREYQVISKGGNRLSVEMSTSFIKRKSGEAIGFVSITRDITKRKRMEQALMESEEKWRSLVQNAPNLIIIVDSDGTMQFMNRTVSGISVEEATGRSIYDYIQPEYHDVVRETIGRVFKTGEPGSYEVRGVGPGESISWYETYAGPIKRDGQVVAVTLIATDITESKQAEEALRESENRYRVLLENLPQKIFLKDKNSVYVSCNKNYARGLKIKAEEIAGKTDYEFYPKELAEKYRTDDKRIMESGKIEDIEERYIQDGRETIVHTVKTPVKGEKGNIIGILGIFWDITERKRMEQEIKDKNEQLSAQNEELRATEEELCAANEELQAANEELRDTQEKLVRSERLAVIGQLAGGVGHELRNPLSAIKNAIYYVRGKVAKSELGNKEPRVMEFLNIADDEINSSNKIINDLLGFSRVGKPAVSPARIEKVIDDALSHTTIPENIVLTKKLDTDLPEVKIDTDQVRQVLVNMIINAAQAMPDGGRLTISAREKDKFLEVEIADTGCGIPQEVMDKIFDPLFTTRAKGIGLGLAVCKAIIDRHQGHIEVESKVGKETIFTIKLPLEAE